MSTSTTCGQCGHSNRAEARFCARCGSELTQGTAGSTSHLVVSQELQPEPVSALDPVVAARVTPLPAVLAGYRDLEGRSQMVQRVFVAVIIASAVAIVFDVMQIGIAARIVAGEYVSSAELEASDNRQAIIALVVLGLWVVAAIVFIRWFAAAYHNVAAFGHELRFKTGWAIGGWFVPILSFWRPKQIANDIWRGSDPAAPRHVDIWSRPVPTLFGLWWAAWIIGLFLSRAAFRSGLSASTAEELQTAAMLDALGFAIDIAGAALAIVVVRRTTARQTACAAHLRSPQSAEGERA